MSALWTRIRLRLAFDRPLLPVLTAVFIGVCISTLLAYTHTKAAVEDLAQSQILQTLGFLDHEVGIQVRDMVSQARLVSQEGVLDLALEDSYLGRSARVAAQRKIEGYARGGAFERFFLMDLAGRVVLASSMGPAAALDYSDRHYFLEARAGRPALETVLASRITGRPALVSARPVRGPDGTVHGVLVAIMDTASFAREILDRIRMGQSGGGYVLGSNGAMLARPAWAANDEFAPGVHSGEILRSADAPKILRYSRQGARRMCAARHNDITGWTLVVEADEAEVLAPATRLATVSAAIAFLTLALVALALGALRKVLVNLRNSEADQRTLTELSPVGIVTFSRHGLPVYMNRQARAILGIGKDDALPVGIFLEDAQGAPLEDKDSPMAAVLAEQRSVIGLQAWYRHPSGERKALYVNATPLSRQGEGAHGMVATLEDITGRVRSVEQLKQSEERFSKLFRLSPEAVLLLDYESTKVMDANEAFYELTGYAAGEILGRTTLDIDLYLDVSRRAAFYELLRRDGHVDNLEFEGRRKDGRTFLGSLSAQVIEIRDRTWLMTLIRDITEAKKMHEMMIQTEKMISVGGIAAGIAHEINNPLGIVLQAAQNLLQRTRPDFPKNQEAAGKLGLSMEQIQQYMQARKLDVFIQDIQSAAARASGIIRHMLDFSRRSESRRTACDLPGIIDKAIDLAGSDYDLKKSYDFRRIKIVKSYDADLPPVSCTETEIEQVLLNLLRNAAQALAAASPPVEDPRIDIRVSSQPGQMRIEIADNGPGIPAELQRRVFEPFYTTKPPGVGTGLGLSVSYFIVTKGHGGTMSVSSQPGAGAAFTIELPMEENPGK